jgi:hypothetical protein
MKPLIILFLSVNSVFAFGQDCTTSLLFRKGTTLEYKTSAPKGGLFSRGGFFEMTRLMFIVNDVKDSNNISYSYVTKVGVNPNDEQSKYEKKYIIACDGINVSIPVDFYGIDTVYFSNMYPKVKKDKGIYSSTVVKGKSLYLFPVNFEKNKFEINGDRLTMNTKIRDYEMARMQVAGAPNTGMEFSGRITEDTYSMETSVKKYEVKGKEKITTPAGTFDCYKIVVSTDMEAFGRGINNNSIIYYHPEAGYVKSETQQAKIKGGYVELVSIKK